MRKAYACVEEQRRLRRYVCPSEPLVMWAVTCILTLSEKGQTLTRPFSTRICCNNA